MKLHFQRSSSSGGQQQAIYPGGPRSRLCGTVHESNVFNTLGLPLNRKQFPDLLHTLVVEMRSGIVGAGLGALQPVALARECEDHLGFAREAERARCME